MADVEQDIIVRADTSGAVSGLNAAREAMERETQAAQASVVPHRAAHQALALVSMEMANMAGASRTADAAVRVFDSVLFSMVATGGAVSGGFIALTAAAVGIVSWFKNSSDEAKKLDDELKKIADSETEAAMKADKLTAAQRQVATLHAAELQPQLMKATQDYKDQGEKLAALRTVVVDQAKSVSDLTYGYKSLGTGMMGTTAEITEQEKKMIAAKGRVDELTASLKAATQASAGVGAAGRNIGPSKILPTVTDAQASDMYIKQYEQHLQDLAKTSAEVAKKMQTSVGKAAEFMGHSAGMAFGKMAMEGKSAAEAFSGFAKTMAEDFIAKVTAMIVKWLVLKALMAAGGGGALSAFSGFMGHATGFSGTVSGPTPMMVGEGGEPEHVTVTPLSQMGGGSGSGGSGGGNVSIGQIVIQGITDPKAIAQQVGLEIAKAVRGRGQVGMVGPGLYGT